MNLDHSAPAMDSATVNSSAFSVVIIHEDELTEYRAKRMLQRVLNELDWSEPISLRMCPVSSLAETSSRRQLARVAGESQIVVLSVYAGHLPQSEIQDWLENWDAPQAQQPRAFAVLLHGDSTTHKSSKIWLSKLRRAAQSNHADFFYGLCDVCPPAPAPAMHQAVRCLVSQRPGSHTDSAVFTDHRVNQRHWGINE